MTLGPALSSSRPFFVLNIWAEFFNLFEMRKRSSIGSLIRDEPSCATDRNKFLDQIVSLGRIKIFVFRNFRRTAALAQ
jgi:hypothetical protein